MHVRAATHPDADVLKALDEVARNDPSRRAYIDRSVANAACFVAVVDNAPVGYAVLTYHIYDNGWVDMLFVAQGSRRRGVGAALLTHLRRSCKTPKLFTSTNESNGAMQALLASLGFQPSGVIHNLDHGDPELVYVSQLGAQAV